jgi:hypothetical protein
VARTLAAEGELGVACEEYAVAVDGHAPPYSCRCRGTLLASDLGGARQRFRPHRHLPQPWFARRSLQVDRPRPADNLVAGGAAGATVAAVPGGVERPASPPACRDRAGRRRRGVCREHADGLQFETLYVHDLALASDFVPRPQDGEAVEHRCVSCAEAARLVAQDKGQDVVTVDASLVVVDFLLRHGALDPDAGDYLALARLGHCPLPG